MRRPTDAELLKRVKDGDSRALIDLLTDEDRFLPVIQKAISGLTDQDQKDVVQNLAVIALKKIGTWRGSDSRSFCAWIARIARNLCIDVHRRQKSAADTGDSDQAGLAGVPDETSGPVTNAGRREIAELLQFHCEQLSDVERRVINLRFLEGATPTEIGEIIGSTDAAVRSLIYRTLLKLRRQMGRTSRYF